jgi:hypothetical protein
MKLNMIVLMLLVVSGGQAADSRCRMLQNAALFPRFWEGRGNYCAQVSDSKTNHMSDGAVRSEQMVTFRSIWLASRDPGKS